MELRLIENGFEVCMGGRTVLAHTRQTPMLFIGTGQESIDMYRGNFQISDYIEQRSPLRSFVIDGDTVTFATEDGTGSYTLTFKTEGSRLTCTGGFSSSANRLWLRLPAVAGEHIYGGGEQFSHLDLRGKRFQMFTREQGVGRNKSEYITFLADQEKAGGDYDWTFFPAPTFVSSKSYFFHLANYCYSALDFTHEQYHEVEMWDTEIQFVLDEDASLKGLLGKLTDLLGRQPPLPDWALRGIWLGIQGGTQVADKKADYMRKLGADVTGLWCQDWEGVRHTSFGKRLMWNWMVDETLYPGLIQSIQGWQAQGMSFMGYINPYLCEEKCLFREAEEKGLLALNTNGETYLVDFGEFYCGIVDFTNPTAFAWYKEVIKEHLIGVGLKGWMADFGEYLPTDCVLHSGESALAAHNKWPMLWARLNYEVLCETGNLGKLAVYFRAGATGSQRYAPLMWAGDQNVDWSLDDGLASVVVAALSSGMTGHGVHTSDVGGYTTLYHLKRTKELLLRWAEFCAFTPVLRTHEGNRPDSNWQFDSDEETARQIAWCSRLHTALFPYTKAVLEETWAKGVPAMRPLFLEYPQDEATYSLKYQYLYGADLLVAPVYTQGAQTVEVYTPDSSWRSIWDDSPLAAGSSTTPAPLGRPAVFYRAGSAHTTLFQSLKTI